MKFVVYRPTGDCIVKDVRGNDVRAYQTISPVGTVEAPSLAEALKAARSVRDPAPILDLVQ